jgi:hypothetical protein
MRETRHSTGTVDEDLRGLVDRDGNDVSERQLCDGRVGGATGIAVTLAGRSLPATPDRH